MRENIWKNIKLGFKTNKLAVAGAAAIILLALISIFCLFVSGRSQCHQRHRATECSIHGTPFRYG
ncbi:MAG: hypothetical protein ACLSBD_06270 [Blautia massiliensis (ex Durand et al. 2017)]